jgi:hypothetical protein
VLRFCGLGTVATKPKVPEKAPAAGSSFNQLLGIKGAKQETVSSSICSHELVPHRSIFMNPNRRFVSWTCFECRSVCCPVLIMFLVGLLIRNVSIACV